MKHKIFKVLLVVLLVPLWGCVEVKDKEPGAAPEIQEAVAVPEYEDLTIAEDLYLYQGQFLSADELQNQGRAEELSRQSEAYSFRFRKLTFTSSGRLFTMGHKLTLQLDELVSDNGQVATFPEQAVAPQGHNGRHGGHIYIAAKNASGFMTITLRGEKGGLGLAGPDPDTALKGTRGVDADKIKCLSLRKEEFCYSGPGNPGLKGYPGGQGGSGGNTGTLSLEVKANDVFQPQIYRIVGPGGDGGPGGLGGEGGDGGHSYRKNPREGAGHQGPRGPQGDRGPQGLDGVQEAFCSIDAKGSHCF
ncbi:MAG: hypothetical protein OM95_01205 [Bdellovibrio sp. ArHS]|uniref:hypothetical protein n=1 Tax=Bdellovibrio sp. ArHS TaxID=1569284 RepID=UPI000583EA49|nr:hypothetical protein [Bdellovibrio sp. ArHS]KHD89722.1 MAG: hypothetical protein OM95_01205 [Bdellovibrio sp. ArHS]